MRNKRMLRWVVSRLWPVIDRLVLMIRRIKPLTTDGNGIVGVELRRYKGLGLMLEDGSEVKPGDEIIELHLNSAWFRERRKLGLTTSGWQWKAIHYFAKDLGLLAEQMSNGMFDRVTALHGRTLLHVIAKRLGFQIQELPDTSWKRLTRFYLAGLRQIYYLGVGERLKMTDKPPELKEIWLSASELLRRYGSRHQ